MNTRTATSLGLLVALVLCSCAGTSPRQQRDGGGGVYHRGGHFLDSGRSLNGNWSAKCQLLGRRGEKGNANELLCLIGYPSQKSNLLKWRWGRKWSVGWRDYEAATDEHRNELRLRVLDYYFDCDSLTPGCKRYEEVGVAFDQTLLREKLDRNENLAIHITARSGDRIKLRIPLSRLRGLAKATERYENSELDLRLDGND